VNVENGTQKSIDHRTPYCRKFFCGSAAQTPMEPKAAALAAVANVLRLAV
jgi:hypothetical protein